MGITVSVVDTTQGATGVTALTLGPSAVADPMRRPDLTAGDVSPGEQHRLRETWPLHTRQVRDLVIAGAVLTVVFSSIGWLLTNALESSSVVSADERIATRLADARTPTWNSLSWWGSMLAETAPKIVVTALLSIILLRVWKRWLEPVLVSVALILEASVFLAVTLIVGRPRPGVEHLDGSPIGSSFPSGHAAAAVVYAMLAVIVFWHTRSRLARLVAVLVTVAIPVVVGLARMYRGMHFLSDVVAGILLGSACVVLTLRIVMTSPEAADAFPEHAR